MVETADEDSKIQLEKQWTNFYEIFWLATISETGNVLKFSVLNLDPTLQFCRCSSPPVLVQKLFPAQLIFQLLVTHLQNVPN